MTNFQRLAAMGWRPFFQQQLTLEEWDQITPVRVTEQHKSQLTVAADSHAFTLPITPAMPPLVVGDWILLNENKQFVRSLERYSCFKRKSAGTGHEWQLIAANVDTAFIVCSMNEDFNPNRIERYLALAQAADAEPVVVLTKADLTDEAESWRDNVRRIDKQLQVVTVNALENSCMNALGDWLKPGNTVVMLGSSGVGKSTLTNTLLGEPRQSTQEIREDDAKGRHTTTGRSLFPLPQGGLILDTPGMRELQLADCHKGIVSAFADIQCLAEACRFADCQHDQEPGCAVQAAVEQGSLDSRRLVNYHKLLREDALNSASLAQKRAKDKAFTRFVNFSQKESRKFKGR
ncbi:MAG: ribosome small subunit-dependent GTPase A [Gammaproteobacteria bacterium]|nr:ribosome small subunit-dependent GTPase A [Gammaproteobacteria bacterium]